MSEWKSIQHLANLATDFMGTGNDQCVADLNRRLGYCEAILDLITHADLTPPATEAEKGEG